MRLVPTAIDPPLEAFDLILERPPAGSHGSIPIRVHAQDAIGGV